MAKRSADSIDGIKLRGEVWYEDFHVSGHPRFRGCIGTRDRATAVAFVAKKKAALILGTHRQEKPEVTVAQAVVRLWEEQAQYWKTAEQAQHLNRMLVRELGANTTLSSLNYGQLSAFVAKRRAGRENGSVNREIGHLRQLVNACEEWGYRVPDPAIPWHARRGPSLWLPEPVRRQTLLPEALEEEFFRALRTDFHPVVRFALASGQRRENVFGLRWDQIDWDAKTITFRVKSKLPGGKEHVVPLTPHMVAIIAGERDRHPVYVFTYICRRAEPGGGDPEKRRVHGERYPVVADSNGFARAWDRARKAVALPGRPFRFHDLRHTFGTRTARDMPLGRVQHLLGHADIATTMRYSTTSLEDARDSLEAYERKQGENKRRAQTMHKAVGEE